MQEADAVNALQPFLVVPRRDTNRMSKKACCAVEFAARVSGDGWRSSQRQRNFCGTFEESGLLVFASAHAFPVGTAGGGRRVAWGSGYR